MNKLNMKEEIVAILKNTPFIKSARVRVKMGYAPYMSVLELNNVSDFNILTFKRSLMNCHVSEGSPHLEY